MYRKARDLFHQSRREIGPLLPERPKRAGARLHPATNACGGRFATSISPRAWNWYLRPRKRPALHGRRYVLDRTHLWFFVEKTSVGLVSSSGMTVDMVYVSAVAAFLERTVI